MGNSWKFFENSLRILSEFFEISLGILVWVLILGNFDLIRGLMGRRQNQSLEARGWRSLALKNIFWQNFVPFALVRVFCVCLVLCASPHHHLIVVLALLTKRSLCPWAFSGMHWVRASMHQVSLASQGSIKLLKINLLYLA